MISANTSQLYITDMNGASSHMYKQPWFLCRLNFIHITVSLLVKKLKFKTSIVLKRSPVPEQRMHSTMTPHPFVRSRNYHLEGLPNNPTAMLHSLRLILNPSCSSYLPFPILLLPISSSSLSSLSSLCRDTVCSWSSLPSCTSPHGRTLVLSSSEALASAL